MSIKRKLLILVLSAVLPVLIFSAGLIGFVTHQQLKSIEMGLKGNTRALSIAVEEQITAIKSSLIMLSIVEDFDDDLKGLHRRLGRFVKNQKDWHTIGLSTLEGEQIFSSFTKYGTVLPSWSDDDFFQRALKTETPALSSYRIAKVSGIPVFSVAIPVKVQGKIKYMLVATIRTTILSKMLLSQNLPSTWTSSIIDQKGIIMARSRNDEEISGTPATKGLYREILKKREGFFEDLNKEGQKTFGAHTRPATIEWTVVLGMPSSDLQLFSLNILWILMIGGGTILTISVYFSLFISNKIALSITALSASARSLGKGEKPFPVVSNLSEVQEVAWALENAAEERDDADRITNDLYQKAQEAIQLRDTFLSVASHELKTPLTTINLQAQMMQRLIKNKDELSSEKFNNAVIRILNQLKRLTALIDDLLDVSRITAGRLEIYKEKMNLTEVAKEIISQFDVTYSTIKLLHDAPIDGYFDRNRMEQVLTNLISNAVKYGSGNPITVDLEKRDNRAIIKVTDQGIGISSENHEKIFDRFERIVSMRDVSGLGLGLWIVKRIVDHLEGTIRVESEGLGKGSIFIVNIPTNIK